MTDGNTGGSYASPSDVEREAEVNAKNPWGDDKFERVNSAKLLTGLVSGARGAPFCIAVDGGWGSGKTFFLKRWCAEFSKQGKAIYFNAWKDDFHADPLTAIIGQLWDALENGVLRNIYDSMKANGQTIIKKSVLNYSGSGLTPDDLKTAAGKTVGNYLEARQNIDVLQKRLRKLAKTTRRQTGLPLVFVVDELDRCRPTFAIELLERVKHIVGVPDIVFVLGINQKELEKSIQSIYGEIDVADYLRKFFDIGMTLPQAEASKYCRHLIDTHKISKSIKESNIHRLQGRGGLSSDWYNIIEEGIPVMASYMGLSLRQVEQAVRMWLVALRGIENADSDVRAYQLEGSLAIFVLLRIKDRDMYENFFNEDCAIKDIMDCLLRFLPWQEILGNNEYSTQKYWRYCMRSIVMACCIFCTERELREIIDEFQQARSVAKTASLSKNYFHVPQKIIEVQHDDSMWQDLMQILSESLEYTKGIRMFYSPPSRQAIIRFLEWGDNLRE